MAIRPISLATSGGRWMGRLGPGQARANMPGAGKRGVLELRDALSGPLQRSPSHAPLTTFRGTERSKLADQEAWTADWCGPAHSSRSATPASRAGPWPHPPRPAGLAPLSRDPHVVLIA